MPEEVVHDPAPMGRKWSFALGAYGSMATHTAIGFFLAPFLLEIAAVCVGATTGRRGGRGSEGVGTRQCG